MLDVSALSAPEEYCRKALYKTLPLCSTSVIQLLPTCLQTYTFKVVLPNTENAFNEKPSFLKMFYWHADTFVDTNKAKYIS